MDALLDLDDDYLMTRYSPSLKGYLCQYCQAVTKSPAGLRRHYSVYCEQIPTYASVGDALQGTSPSSGVRRDEFRMVTCPLCECPLKESRLQSHMRRVHLARKKSRRKPRREPARKQPAEDLGSSRPWLVFTGRVESSRRRH